MSTDQLRVGVLALQGAVTEHSGALIKAGVKEVVQVKRPQHLEGLDGLVLPGGESTTIGKLMNQYELMEPIRKMGQAGIPLFGTCAGLILLASRIQNQQWSHLGLMDTLVDRNSFGRQRESFEANLQVDGIEGDPFPAVFIRAPHIIEVGPTVKVLSHYDGRIVTARQDNLLAASFHPELTDDSRLHQYFVQMIKQNR
ncbi:MAG: pyridoxal 5-phosphate synthase glutaminase subunit PdxT [Bacilli bacterium]|nr:pyridoxal 5-phosphate synthase glutaminase subunit PdxT [Bacilli bacterium]